MNVNKEAMKDAVEFVAAQMAYGEGAGNRRKLIESAVQYKVDRIPGYAVAFDRAVYSQDVVKHVQKAKAAARTSQVTSVVGKNTKAALRGDVRSMSTPLAVGLIVFAVAHQTGYDKKAWAYGKRKTQDVRAWIRRNI